MPRYAQVRICLNTAGCISQLYQYIINTPNHTHFHFHAYVKYDSLLLKTIWEYEMLKCMLEPAVQIKLYGNPNADYSKIWE